MLLHVVAFSRAGADTGGEGGGPGPPFISVVISMYGRAYAYRYAVRRASLSLVSCPDPAFWRGKGSVTIERFLGSAESAVSVVSQ